MGAAGAASFAKRTFAASRTRRASFPPSSSGSVPEIWLLA
jgi:hypothetical protein